MSLTVGQLASVLSAMSKEMHHRIITTATGQANQVLWPLYMTLLAGTDECIRLAKEEQKAHRRQENERKRRQPTPIKNDPENYITVGMAQDKIRKGDKE